MTEEEVLAVINNIANRLAYKFKFGYHDIEDMKQQARLEAWKGLASYDNKRPLENFLWTHVRNRLFNLKRDKYQRPDKPCLHCPFAAYLADTDECGKYLDKMDCELYEGWQNRNSAKRNIMSPIGISNVQDEEEESMKRHYDLDSVMARKEIIDIIEQHISVKLRRDYLTMKFGGKLSKQKRERLKEAIEVLLEERGIDVEEAW